VEQRVRVRPGRTVWAGALTAAAIAVPGAAWYLAGSAQADRAAEQALGEAGEQARATAKELASRLAERLRDLREAELRRPYYHYQNLYHDPEGVSQGVSLARSPLANGPAHPFVRNYFQIDGAARVTLPTHNPEAPTAGPRRDESADRELLASLSEAAPALRAGAAVGQASEPAQVQTLAPSEWAQNVNANRLFQQLQNKATPAEIAASARGRERATIEVGPLSWKTIHLAGTPALVSLRDVQTPTGVLRQGFVLSTAAIDASFRGAALPSAFRPGPPRTSADALVALEGARWHVESLPASLTAAAVQRGAEIRSSFRTTFLLGASIAVLAGAGVVLLVWQSDRLARQRSQFAASAAHELRTPLAGMRMYSEMIALGLGDPARSADYAQRVAVEAERLGRVVGNVLQFTGLERGLVSIHAEPGDLAPVVREAVSRLRPVLETAGAALELEVDEPLPPVRFHAEAVFQILSNLVDNAEKYSRGCPDRTVRVALAPDASSGGATLSVADRGPGISPEVQRRLFRAFSRGGGAGAPAGLGLGLTLARALARAQGAEIQVAGARGAGAVFSVTFRS
jgi:signal transduction histidine kinase